MQVILLRNALGGQSTGLIDGKCGKQQEYCGEDKFCCLIAWHEEEKACLPNGQDCPGKY